MIDTDVDVLTTEDVLKINAKLGGLNYLLDVERSKSIPYAMVLGMDVFYGSVSKNDAPSLHLCIPGSDS